MIDLKPIIGRILCFSPGPSQARSDLEILSASFQSGEG
jgi:hypothetical protein